MSHQINTTIRFSRTNRNIKRALKKYFEPGSYDLNYRAILPPPAGLTGEQLMVWMGENWGSRPFTFDGRIRDNKLEFHTINGIPAKIYQALAKRLQDYLLITTASRDDMFWAQVEFRANGDHRTIYRASEDEMTGNVPPSIRGLLATHKAICGQSHALPKAVPCGVASPEYGSRQVDEKIPF